MPGVIQSRAKLTHHQAPQLAKWLRRASEHQVNEDYYALVFEQFGYPADDYHLAQLRAVADGLDPQRQWVCADPLHVAIDVAHIYSLGNAYLALTEAEVTDLIASINELLDGKLRLVAPHPLRWYLELPEPWQFDSVSPHLLLGSTLVDKMPTGKHARSVKKLFNEIQMLLFDHEINQQRRARQQPTVDGVWLWGVGKTVLPIAHSQWDAVVSDDPIVCELARINNIQIDTESKTQYKQVLLIDTQYQFQDAADLTPADLTADCLAGAEQLFIGNGLMYGYRPWWARLCNRS